MINLILLALPVIILSYTGQILLKQGVNRVGGFDWTTISAAPVSFLGTLFTNPFILGGFATAGLGAIVYLFLLAQGDFTVVFPVLGAVGFVLLPLIGRLFLQESITSQRLVGTLIIALGMLIVARS